MIQMAQTFSIMARRLRLAGVSAARVPKYCWMVTSRRKSPPTVIWSNWSWAAGVKPAASRRLGVPLLMTGLHILNGDITAQFGVLDRHPRPRGGDPPDRERCPFDVFEVHADRRNNRGDWRWIASSSTWACCNISTSWSAPTALKSSSATPRRLYELSWLRAARRSHGYICAG